MRQRSVTWGAQMWRRTPRCDPRRWPLRRDQGNVIQAVHQTSVMILRGPSRPRERGQRAECVPSAL